jgi:hypothetical protein
MRSSRSTSAKVATILKNILPIGSAGSWICPPGGELDAAFGYMVADVAGVRNRTPDK